MLRATQLAIRLSACVPIWDEQRQSGQRKMLCENESGKDRTDHYVRLDQRLPHRQPPLLLIILQHRRYHASDPLGRKEDLPGPFGAEGVPDRVRRVARTGVDGVVVARVVFRAVLSRLGDLRWILKGVPKGSCRRAGGQCDPDSFVEEEG